MDARENLLAAASALNPAQPATRDQYVAPPDGGIHRWITKTITRDPSAHLLAIGDIGSGKTTELLRAQGLIEERGIARAWHVPLDEYFDLGNLGEGRLVTLAGLAMLSVLRGQDPLSADLHEAAVALHELLRSDREVTAPLALRGYAKARGTSAPPVAAADVAQKIEVLARRWREGRTEPDGRTKPERRIEREKIVLLVDALDRRGFFDFLSATSEDLRVLRKLGVGVVIVGNLEWRHDMTVERREAFDADRFQWSYDPSTQRDAGFLHEVLMKRAPGVFSRDVAEAIVTASGGGLRDLLHLARETVNQALDLDGTRVSAETCAEAIDAYREGLLVALNPKEREGLDDLMNGKPLDATMGDRLHARGCAIVRAGALEPHPVMRTRPSHHEAA